MSEGPGTPLFPLPLVPFERYMLADDRADYPMVFPMVFELAGRMQRSALEAAVDRALRAHPLLRALVQTRLARRPCWVDGATLPISVDWDVDGVPLRFPHGQSIELARQPGLRLWVRQGEDQTRLTAQFHHACCDGIGALRFLADLLAAYGEQTAPEGQAPCRRPVQAESLRGRGRFAPRLPAPVSAWRAGWSTVREAVRWATRRPSVLSGPRGGPVRAGEPREYPDIHAHRFDADQSRALRDGAGRLGATLNDLLLRDLLLTLAAWNAEHDRGRAGQWLQVNMPTNMRERLGDPMPAANRMSYAFLARRRRDLLDPQSLLRGIVEETRAVKRWGLGMYFLTGLDWALKVPGAMTLMTAGNRCYATAVLTNLGDLSRRLDARFPRCDGRIVAGDVILERVWVVAPLRPLTRASFAAFTYSDQLNLNLLCDPGLFSPAAAKELLDRYVKRIEQSCTEKVG